MKTKKPICKFTGKDGNVFSIIANVSTSLNREGQKALAKEWREKAMNSKSYDAVLALAYDYVYIE